MERDMQKTVEENHAALRALVNDYAKATFGTTTERRLQRKLWRLADELGVGTGEIYKMTQAALDTL